MAVRFDLDMSLSREEFFRLLPAAVGPHGMREDGAAWGSDGIRTWSIRPRPLEDRRLGRVVLPRHQVEITLEGYDQEEAMAFLARFHRAFQRGGG